MPTVGLILGSTRLESNTAGVETYLLSILSTKFPGLDIKPINLRTSTYHPLPLLLDSIPPAGHSLESLPNIYGEENVRGWSSTVLGWDGMIICTPQYNWGIPAPLKNALDHLFNEFHDMPVAFVTVGGRGGTKVEDALKIVCGGGMDMRVCQKSVNVSLPKENIRGSVRAKGDEEWLSFYEKEMEEMVLALESMLRPRFDNYKASK